MTEWKIPPVIKVYEALGCVADKRVHMKGNDAVVLSSQKDKQYIVKYDPIKKAIMSNDNGSYWQGYLGYPAIAFLLLKGVLTYDIHIANVLADINWNEMNEKNKRDYNQTIAQVHEKIAQGNIPGETIRAQIESIVSQIAALQLQVLGPKLQPPR